MSVRVVNVRGSCQLQDEGRPGEGAIGIPQGGFSDEVSAHMANALVSLPIHTPLMECTLGGPTLLFEADCEIAITGAEVSPRIEGVPVRQWQRLHVKAGQTLSCQHAKFGLRTYISFSRRLSVDKWRNSVSPLVLGGAVYPSGSVLEKGCKLDFCDPIGVIVKRINRTYVNVPFYLDRNKVEEIQELKLLRAPESDDVVQNSKWLAELTASTWGISPVSSRMGIRLVGPSLSLGKTFGRMRSGPVLPGTVQLLPDGQLIITHVDSQTIGGYPRIGLVDAIGISVLAQAVPGRSAFRLRF